MASTVQKNTVLQNTYSHPDNYAAAGLYLTQDTLVGRIMSKPGLVVANGSLRPATNTVRWVSARRSRVCDRCIKCCLTCYTVKLNCTHLLMNSRQKIKCDLNQPRCSACAAAGCPCSYSHTRKTPGPIRGFSKRSGRPLPTVSSDPASSISDTGMTLGKMGVATAAETPSHPLSTPAPTEESCPPLQSPGNNPSPICTASSGATEILKLNSSQLSIEIRRELAQSFVSTVNASFPLFRTSTFHSQLNHGEINGELASIIYAIAAKLTDISQSTDIDIALTSLVDASTVKTANILEPSALNDWRTACLLAWYGFYQYPGQKGDVRITILARKAYNLGLHQIDSLPNLSSYGWKLLSDETLEDWRHVWWSIYLLDTHLSYTSATPAQIQPDSIGTALFLENSTASTDWRSATRIFIPADQADLWKVTHEIVAVRGQTIINLHIAVSALLKEALAVHRRAKQNPRYSSRERILVLEDCLCGMQLSLPFNYTRTMRDSIGGETPASYHCRLLTIVKIYTIQLILNLSKHQEVGTLLEAGWRGNLEVCHRMFELICQWNATQCAFTTDPELCLIVMALLVFMHLHDKGGGNLDSTPLTQLVRRKEILRVILRNHAKRWVLAWLLLGSYDSLANSVVGPLSFEDICLVIDHFHGPLHVKWLNLACFGHVRSLEQIPAPMYQ